MKRVVIGLSGGVDSSVAAYLLKEQGYEVIGITYKMLEEFNIDDAKRIADELNIEFHYEDISEDFKSNIINSFIESYENGLTPNPCVKCNKYIKFNYLEKARIKYNADYIATGHYAKVADGNVYVSEDANKDQTYFLGCVDKEILKHVIFPLEGITKDKVREIAQKLGLSSADKKDSFDVCFIKDKFNEFMENNSSYKTGDIILLDNNTKIGTHKGLIFYTIGQRKGLDIGGTEERLFVAGKDIEKNILYVTLGSDSDYLYSDYCIIDKVNFLTDKIPDNCEAKFRYRSQKIPVELELANGQVKVIYKDKAKAVTPGQTCALYVDNECIGAGEITLVGKDNRKLWYL